MARPSEQHVWWLKRITRLMKKRIDKESPPMPPSDPAPKMSNSFHQCGRCARPLSWNGAGYHPCYSCGDIAENARLMSDPAAVPPRTSCCQHLSDCAQHNAPAEPAGPCDCGKGGPPCGGEPVPPPEFDPAVVEAVRQVCVAIGERGGSMYGGYPMSQMYDIIKAYGASVRERALREAAAKCLSQSRLIGHRIEGIREGWSKSDAGQLSRYEGWVASANWCEQDILALIHTPPSGGGA